MQNCFQQVTSGMFRKKNQQWTPVPSLSSLDQETELQFRPDPARKLSANLYDIYHCCVYSEKLLMMDRGNVRNM